MLGVGNSVYVSVGHTFFELELETDVIAFRTVRASLKRGLKCRRISYQVCVASYGEPPVSSIHVGDKRMHCVETVALQVSPLRGSGIHEREEVA